MLSMSYDTMSYGVRYPIVKRLIAKISDLQSIGARNDFAQWWS